MINAEEMFYRIQLANVAMFGMHGLRLSWQAPDWTAWVLIGTQLGLCIAAVFVRLLSPKEAR